MEMQYYGANAVKITTKQSVLLIDPISDITTIKADLKKATLVLATQEKFLPKGLSEDVFVANGPGEYEFADISVRGMSAQAHTEASGDKSATVYRLESGDISVLVVGHIFPSLTDDRLESIGLIDVMILPVGGGGYTLDPTEAANVVKAVEPKVVIPVHYGSHSLNYEVPQQELDVFLKELGAQAEEPVDKLKLKQLPDKMIIQPLTQS